jgi:hypothetical protein
VATSPTREALRLCHVVMRASLKSTARSLR